MTECTSRERETIEVYGENGDCCKDVHIGSDDEGVHAVTGMSGDNIAPEIARLKGENEAIIRAMRIKGCAAVPGPVVTIEEPEKQPAKTATR